MTGVIFTERVEVPGVVRVRGEGEIGADGEAHGRRSGDDSKDETPIPIGVIDEKRGDSRREHDGEKAEVDDNLSRVVGAREALKPTAAWDDVRPLGARASGRLGASRLGEYDVTPVLLAVPHGEENDTDTL